MDGRDRCLARVFAQFAVSTLLLYTSCGGDPTGLVSLNQLCGTNCSIVFAERTNFIWDLYTISADGGSRRPLTTDTATDVYPAWSPDHRRIAFWSGREPAGIYVMGADGSNRRFLVAHDTEHMSWSPDGKRIALDGTSDLGYDIFVMNADGTGLQDITNSGDSEQKPAWSPKGDLIAYNRGNEIWVMDPRGGNRSSLTGWQTQPAFDPSWSPDGTKIVFSSIDDRGITNLHIMDADGRNWRRLTTTDRPADRIPDWSPDGAQVVFQRDFSDSVGVYVVNVSGGQPRRLSGGISGHASW